MPLVGNFCPRFSASILYFCCRICYTVIVSLFKSQIPKAFVFFAIMAFLAVGILGLSKFGMPTGPDGQMQNCSFMNMGGSVVCKMTPFEHMAAWQSMFTSLPLKDISVLASLLLLVAVVVFLTKKLWGSQELELVSLHKQRFRDKTFFAHSPLQEAFSNGILNPKLF